MNNLACTSPLVEGDKTFYGGLEKAEVLASHFAKKLTVPQDDPLLRAHQGYLENMRRNHPVGELQPVTILEVKKALDSLAAKKAPGPDGIPAEVFQQLSSLHEPLTQLFTVILKKGRMPQGMLALYFIPLDKPGKPRTA